MDRANIEAATWFRSGASLQRIQRVASPIDLLLGENTG
jgi:hypothetical protein